VNKEKTCSRAVAERAKAIAAKTKCRQQLNNFKAELDASKKEVSRQSTASKLTQASPANKREPHSSVAKFSGFVDGLRALPAPAVAADLATLTPIEIPIYHLYTLLDQLR